MKTSSQPAQVLGYPERLQHIPGLAGFMADQASFWVFGPEAILCTGIGARAARLNRLIWGMPLMLLLTLIAFLAEGSRGYEMLAVTLMVVVGFLHRNALAWDTLRSGTDPTHTWFMGISVLVYLTPVFPRFAHWLLRDPWVTYKFLHPAILIGLGVLVYHIGGSLIVAIYLIISGGLSAGKNALLYATLVDSVLDQFDASLARFFWPQFLRDATQGPGPSKPPAGMPISPALLDVLRQIPPVDMDTIVREAMSTNGTHADGQAQEEQSHG